MRRAGVRPTPHACVVPEACAHRVAAAWLGGIWRGGVHFVTVYFRHTDGFSGENPYTSQETVAFLGTLRGPLVLSADFNMSLAVVRASGWPGVIGGVLFAPSLPTCHGSTYDYFVVASSLAHTVVAAQRVEEVGPSPHFPARLIIGGDVRWLAVRRLLGPRRLDGALPSGPQPASLGYALTQDR